MTDQKSPMDERLREYGERWRQGLPPGPRPDPTLLGPRRRLRPVRWLVVPAAAAAIAAVVLGSQLLDTGGRVEPRPAGRHSSAPAPTAPAPTAATAIPTTALESAGPGTPAPVAPGEVVPWAPLEATHPRIPTVTVPASPDPAVAAAAPACRADDLHAESSVEGAAGTMYLAVRITSAGGPPCRLEGIPDVQPMDGGQPADIPVERSRDDSSYRGPVLVAQRQPALLALSWTSLWCTDPVHNDAVRAVLPDGGGTLTFDGFGRSPYCNGDPGSGPTPIRVWPFQPEQSRPAEQHSVFASVKATGDLNRTAAPGETVRFTVTLTAPERVSLAPCPDYTIAQYGAGVSSEQTYALNCAAVPYRDADGRPYLPSGTPVSFAMETTAGSRSAPKFLWYLDVPERNVEVDGRLTVTDTGPES